MTHFKQKLQHQILLPVMQFISQEKSGGVVLGIAVLLALILANSPLRDDYAHFLHHHLGFVVDGTPYLNFSLAHWINDGLMSMFFFVVGLELKREFIGGELRDLRKVTLPIAAAVMGMIFPALIYLVFNGNTAEAQGWGIRQRCSSPHWPSSTTSARCSLSRSSTPPSFLCSTCS